MLLRRRAAILAIGLFAFLFSTAFVSSPTDFSGSYLEDPNDLKKPAADERLTIQQQIRALKSLTYGTARLVLRPFRWMGRRSASKPRQELRATVLQSGTDVSL
jgi:hypothetical protein